jgi:hypothetical protein
MALIPAPDPAEPEYLMDVSTDWNRAGDTADVRLRISTPEGNAVNDYARVHEQLLHLMVISEDLRHFAHLHPIKRGDGSFESRIQFPGRGLHMLFADFVPIGGGPQLLQQAVVAPGDGPTPSHPVPNDAQIFRTERDLQIDLTVEELRLGTPALLTFRISNASRNTPVTDLQPYLGASGHLFVTSDNFQDAAHVHPLEDSTGPDVRFLVRFGREGRYRAWLQLQRNGEVLISDWTLYVPNR